MSKLSLEIQKICTGVEMKTKVKTQTTKIDKVSKSNKNTVASFSQKTNNDRTLHNYKYRLFENNCKLLDNKMLNDKWYLYCENCWVSNSLRFEHHHIIYRSEKPKHEHLHDINNIILLCIKCHNEFHKCKWIRNDLVKERKLNLLFWDDVLCK